MALPATLALLSSWGAFPGLNLRKILPYRFDAQTVARMCWWITGLRGMRRWRCRHLQKC